MKNLYLVILSSGNCLLDIIIQEVKGGGRNCYAVDQFLCNTLHGYGLHYNTRSTKVNEEIILHFTV